MPVRKPGTTNTLTSLPKPSAPPNPITGLISGISGLAQSGFFTPFGGATPVNQQKPTLATPQTSTIQAPGTKTPLGITVPQTQTATVQKVQPQTTAVQSAPVTVSNAPSGVSPTGNTTALPGQNSPQGSGTSAPLAFNPNFTGLVGQLSSFAQPSQTTNTADATAANAAAEYNRLNKEISDTRQQEAQTIANQVGPIPQGDITGRQAVARNLYETRLAALGAQAQGATALFSPAISAATTGRGQQISAAQSATNAAQPQLGAFGQGYYAPLDYGSVSANSSQYGTGPAAAANVGSIQDQTKLVNDWSAARQGASNISGMLDQFLTTNNVNPTDLNAVNKFLQLIGRNTSSQQYQQFSNLVTDLAALYAQILTPPGGNPSDYRTQIAQSLVDASASGQSIKGILQSLDNQSQQKIQGVQTNIQKLSTGQNPNETTYEGQPSGTSGNIWNW